MKLNVGKVFFDETSAIHRLMLNMEIVNKASFKLGRVECDVLQFLYQNKKPTSMKEVATTIKVSHSRITHLMNSLVKKGYVNRYLGVEDRRFFFAEITESGIKIAEAYKNKNTILFEELVKKLPKEELEDIYKTLEYWQDFLAKMIEEVK